MFPYVKESTLFRFRKAPEDYVKKIALATFRTPFQSQCKQMRQATIFLYIKEGILSRFRKCFGIPRQGDCDGHVSDSLSKSLQAEGVLRHVSVCREGRADSHSPVSRSKPMHGGVVDDHVSVIQRGCADHDSECYSESVLYPESYPYFPVRSSLPECLAHGAIRQVSEAHECEKASSATKNVKEEDAKADKKGEAAES